MRRWTRRSTTLGRQLPRRVALAWDVTLRHRVLVYCIGLVVLGTAWTAVPACSLRRSQTVGLVPALTSTELGLAAQALEDSSAGPFFTPERLADAVALLRRIYRRTPVVLPSQSELNWHPSLQFQMADSLFGRLFDSGAAEPTGFADRWLEPPRTGWAPFDSITSGMGGAIAIHIIGTPPRHGALTVYYREPVNINGVAGAYAGLRPAVTISVLQGLIVTTRGPADRLRMTVADSVWTVHLPAGWADCPDRPDRRPCESRYRVVAGEIEALTDSSSRLR